VLIRVGEFIYLVDFVGLETKKLSGVGHHIPVILSNPFLVGLTLSLIIEIK